MSLEALPALAGVAVSMTWTPGPNNVLLSASGANYGWRRSMPHVMGVTLGFPLMLVVVASGLVRLLGAFPGTAKIVGWLGFAVLAWFAWRIATAGWGKGGASRRPLTFAEAIAFQWVNPKAWALATYVTASFAVGAAAVTNTLLAACVFLLSGLASSCTWAVFGAGIGRALRREWHLRAFNIAMAATLVACGAWLLLRG